MNIRRATEQDLPALADLASSWIGETPLDKQLPKGIGPLERVAHLREQLGRMVRLPHDAQVLVAEHDEHGLVGFAVGAIMFPWFLPTALEAILLALYTPHRHKPLGVTGRLLAAWHELPEVQRCPLQTVHVQDDTDNVGMASLMRNRGFVLAEQRWTRGPRKPAAKE